MGIARRPLPPGAGLGRRKTENPAAGPGPKDARPFSGLFNVARKPAGSNHHVPTEVWPGHPPVKAGARRAFTADRPAATSTAPADRRPTPMRPEPELARLRAEIDRIDDHLVDLLVERLAVVERIAAAKGDRERGRLAMRPAREAAILRRLVARAGGRFPAAPLVRMWRELLAATTAVQTPLAITVWAPPGAEGVWDVARDHLGSATPAERAASPGRALRRAVEAGAGIAVLPLPDDGQDWWAELLEPSNRTLAVIARLPFVPGPGPAALALAALEPEPSGTDCALVVLEADAATSRARLAEALGRGGLGPRWLAVARRSATALHLVEVDGFHARGAPFAAQLLGPLGSQVLGATVLGAYPRPLSAAESAAPAPHAGAATPPAEEA
jgi:chorismate mutase